MYTIPKSVECCILWKMDVADAIRLWNLFRKKHRHRQKVRKHWVHHILQNRLTSILYNTLYPSLRNCEPKRKLFRTNNCKYLTTRTNRFKTCVATEHINANLCLFATLRQGTCVISAYNKRRPLTHFIMCTVSIVIV